MMTARAARCGFCAVALTGFSAPVFAQNAWQTAGGGLWSNAANWTLGLPNGTQDVTNPLSSAPITLNINATVKSFVSASDFTIGAGGRLNGSLADAATFFQINAAFLIQGGGTLTNLSVFEGTASSVTIGSGNNALENTIFGAGVVVASDGFVSLFSANTFNSVLLLGSDSGNENVRLHDGNSRLNIGNSGSLLGFGRVSSFFANGITTNSGLVNANTAGKTLTLGSTFTTGGGTFRASNGGVLVLSTIFDGTGTTAVDVLPGSEVRVSGGTLRGTFASATGSGFTFDSSVGNAINGATINGNATFKEGGFAAVFNENTVTGHIRMESELAQTNIRLHDGNSRLNISSTGLVSGFGTVSSFFANGVLDIDGTLRGDVSGKILRVAPTFTTGSGLIEVTSGGTVSLGGIVTGDGLKVAAPMGQGRVLVNGASIRGTFAQSSGTGLTFTPSIANDLNGADITGNVTLPENSFVAAFNVSTLRGLTSLGEPTPVGPPPSPATLRLHDGNSRVVVPSGAIFRGAGQVIPFFANGVLEVNGVASANVAAGTLRLAPSFLTGSGLFEATNGGTLSIGAIFTGSNANIAPQPGSTVLVDGGSIRGTFASSVGTGLTFSGSTGNSLVDASITGNITVPDGGFVAAFNQSSITGRVRIDTDADNTGIRLHDGNSRLTVTATGSLQGFGRVFPFFANGQLIVRGNATADVAGKELVLAPSFSTLSGELRAREGGVLVISSSLTAEAGSSISVDNQPGSAVLLRSGSITGNLGASTPRGITVASGATNNSLSSAVVAANLILPGNALLQVFGTTEISGTTTLSGPDATIRLHDGNSDLTNSGTLRGVGQVVPFFQNGELINSGLILADGVNGTLRLASTFTRNLATIQVNPTSTLRIDSNYSQPSGLLLANGTVSYAGTLNVAGGTVGGDGVLTGNLSTTGAIVAPGNSPGSLDILGNLTMASTSTLAVEIGGYGQGTNYDLLAVTGQGDLAGTLTVDFLNFVPQVGDTFDVLTRASAGSSGSFSTITSLDPLIEFTTTYTAVGGLPNDRVRVTVTNVIPEPAAAMLMAVPALAMTRRRR